MSGFLKVESEVPFGRAICARLYLNQWQLEQVANHDQITRRYLAWETVRKQTNPFFQNGTGFEGYVIGRCKLPETALDTILSINQHILDAIARMYRFQYNFRSRLMKTLTRELNDSQCIHIWSAYLGAELGRLRAQVAVNEKAQNFQLQTYKLVSTLQPIKYREVEEGIFQTYAVGAEHNCHTQKLHITLNMLNPGQQDAWLVAENIGQFGHPLVRKLLDQM